jgi:hypothetical protein
MSTIYRYIKKLVFYISYPITKKTYELYKKHDGESCYIFGDGISIKFYDLKQFSDKVSIVGNYIPFHNDFESLNAPYCVMTAPFYFSPIFGYENPKFKNYLYKTSKLYKQLISKYKKKYFFLNLSNYPFVKSKNVYFNFLNYSDKRLNETFISNRINCFSGVLRNSISLAIYMGFSKIHLVGCDYTFTPTQQLHWYEKGEGVSLEMPGYENEFFKIASEFAEITTVTLNGKSDILNHITYEQLTGKKPLFRENTELMDIKYLDVLSTWEGYSIY